MSSIVLTGIAANFPVPGNWVETNFAQGAASLSSATYGILILANKSTAGSATADTVIYGPLSTPPLVTDADAVTLLGAGSPAHRMWRAAVAVNKTTPVSVVCVTESVGASATGTITYATTATGAGVTRVYIGENFVEYSIASGDTATVIAAAIKALINAQTTWPVTADNSAGILTITWKTKGPQGNWGRYSSTITGGIATTGTTAVTYMTGGTTADVYTTALATILPYRFYYIVTEASSISGASTQTTAVVTQVGTQALPITGIRQRVFNGSVDTLANTTTYAVALNNARAEIIWSPTNDRPPEELAATAAGIYALEEQPFPFMCNFDGYGNDARTQAIWNVKAPRSGNSPTVANFQSALNNGITPVGVNANGSTYLVSRITTRSLTATVSDYRIRDAHKVTVEDRFADDWIAKLVLQFSGFLIADDPAPGERTPGSRVATPRVIRAALAKLVRDYEGVDLLENGTTIIANSVVQRETSPNTRMSIRVPLDIIDCLHQTCTAADGVGAFLMFIGAMYAMHAAGLIAAIAG